MRSGIEGRSVMRRALKIVAWLAGTVNVVLMGQTGVGPPKVPADAPIDSCLQAGVVRLSAAQTKARLRHVTPVSPPGLYSYLRINTILSFNIGCDKLGNVICISTISGHPLVIPGAIQSVQKWKFRPTTLHGRRQGFVGNLIIKVSGTENGFKTEVLAAESPKD